MIGLYCMVESLSLPLIAKHTKASCERLAVATNSFRNGTISLHFEALSDMTVNTIITNVAFVCATHLLVLLPEKY